MPKYQPGNEEYVPTEKELREAVFKLKREIEEDDDFADRGKVCRLIHLLKEYYCYAPSSEIALEIARYQEEISDSDGALETLRQLWNRDRDNLDFTERYVSALNRMAWDGLGFDDSIGASEKATLAKKIMEVYKREHPDKEVDESLMRESEEILAKI